MPHENNKALIRRYYDEMWNRWDFRLIDTLIAPEIDFRGSLAVVVHGRDGFRNYMDLVRAAFPDFHNTIEELIAEDHSVVARLTYRATHRGELFGIPATGKAIVYAGVAIFRVRKEQVAEGWVLGDTLGLMRQLGVVPGPGSA